MLAFPITDFHQEFNSNEKIADFVSGNFPQAEFPIFGVSSLSDNPVYRQLQIQLPDQHVRHNFFKYLIGRDGMAVALFNKKQSPLSLEDVIEDLLVPLSTE